MINICTIMTTGRTGSDYLQSCLDGVPGILTLPGKTYFYNFFSKLNEKNIKNKEEWWIDEFINQNQNLLKCDEIENKILNLDQKKFKKNVLNEIKNEKLNQQNFILGIFYGYAKLIDKDVSAIKTIVNHSHSVVETNFFLKVFPKSKLLVTIRYPLANLKSGLINWRSYKKDQINQGHNYYYTNRIYKDLEYAKKLTSDKMFVKLETSYKIETKKEICNFLQINYSEKINLATYNDKFWIGDKLSSSRTIDGSFNKKVLSNDYLNFFSTLDRFILKEFYKKIYSEFYEFKKTKSIYSFLYYIALTLPLSYEINEIQNKPFQLRSYYYYLKRVILFWFKI